MYVPSMRERMVLIFHASCLMELLEAKKTANYDSRLTYGIYQITKELNTAQTVGSGKNKKIVYDYPVRNGYLDTLRTMLKAYYKSHITEKMFKYELLK